jgi:CIC family chloride channel protein
MMALFGGIAKVPLAVILMVSEMTMDYTLLIPSMLACSIAYFVSGDNYIYEKQVNVRAESPAHRNEYSVMLLKGFKVRDALTEKVPVISSQMTVDDAANILKMHEVHAIPVVDVGRLVGIVAKQDAMKFIFHGQPDTPVRDMMSTDLIVTYLDESLFDAMNRMIVHQISQLPVVEREDQSRLLGLLSLNDVTKIQCTTNASCHILQVHPG